MQKDRNIARTLNNIADCLMSTQRYNDALKQSLEIYNTTSNDMQHDRNIAITLNSIADCLNSMQQNDDALKYSKQSLEIYKAILRWMSRMTFKWVLNPNFRTFSFELNKI